MTPARPSAAALDRLLRPRSVAIIGASEKPGALGTSVIANLDRLGFDGDVHLVNPTRDRVGGRACLKAAEELPEGVDVAVLAVPRAAVLDAVRGLAARKAGGAIIFSAGFAEGGEDGRREQDALAAVAAESGMVLEGPNCLGFVNYVDHVALTFVETPAGPLGDRPGIGLISQSGAMACVVGVTLSSRGLGLSYSISTGNEAASGVEDYLAHLLDDPHTQVVGLIVEQFRQPRRFLELAAQARALGRPVVLLHPGRSGAARQSAATHTGALAGDHDVMRTLVERQGVIVAGDLEEFGDLLEVALRCPVPPAGGTVMITESGAFKALTLDLCDSLGLDLPPLGDDDAPALRAALPPFVPVSNPLDLTAQGLVDPDLYRRVLAAVLADGRCGTAVFGLVQTDATTCDLKFPHVIGALRSLAPTKSVIFAGLDDGAAVPARYVADLRALGVPYFPSPDRAMRAVARFVERNGRDLEVTTAVPLPLPDRPDPGVVPEHRAKAVLRAIGIPLLEGRLVTTAAEARSTARALGFPVVLKAQAVALPHKSDAGGVVLGLDDEDAVAAGWQRLHDNLALHRPGLVLDGVLVERMGARGVELIVGGRNDPHWGPILLAGFGGVQAELLHDVRLLPADLTVEGIERELGRLRCAPLFRGYRGSPPLDVRAVAELVARLGQVLRAEPSIREVDLNPVVVYPTGQGVVALDAVMLVD